MTGPLVVEFTVDCAPAHAFEVWTTRCGLWWPPAHTVSGDAEAILFEPRPGGRIYERSGAGAEHDWGTVLEWVPPVRLRYRWHLFFDPSEATEVEVTFTGRGKDTGGDTDGGTLVRIEQTGWDRLGAAGPPRRTRTGEVWTSMGVRFAGACAAA